MARHGWARPGMARHGLGDDGPGKAGHGWVGPGEARQGKDLLWAGQGLRLGRVWRGKAWSGGAWPGEAWQGLDSYDQDSKEIVWCNRDDRSRNVDRKSWWR